MIQRVQKTQTGNMGFNPLHHPLQKKAPRKAEGIARCVGCRFITNKHAGQNCIACLARG